MAEFLDYRKNKRETLFKEFEKSTLKIYDIQNYIPIYTKMFNFDESNFNGINLNTSFSLKSIGKELKFRTYSCYIEDEKHNKQPGDVFFKCSPLIDPIRYMTGKYENETELLKLPSLLTKVHPKIMDSNNSAYTDGFFSFLSSKLLKLYGMHHCINFYDSFLAYQKEFSYDIYDDIEYLHHSDFFNNNKEILFDVDNEKMNILLDPYFNESRGRKPKLQFASLKQSLVTDSINDEMFDGIFEKSSDDINEPDELNNITEMIEKPSMSEKSSSSHSSSCSSRYSYTESDCSDDNSDTESMTSDTSTISSSDAQIYAKIYNFPVEIIALEACSHTLDYLMKQEELDIPQWRSILMQVIMNLLIFQKAFNFTHNDLHTNNIMYVETQREFLVYKYNGIYYKVPTFGKLFKIIDFGRAIYKFKGVTYCSDSYHPNGDAAAQYNCDPYFNENKPRLEPHYGFDLCRLGCALYDDLVGEYPGESKMDDLDPLAKVILEWCTDDKGKNILYKKNGEERFHDFKLYIMIARHVHKPTPKSQLDKEFFNIYQSPKNKISKKTKIMDIDALPTLI